MTPPTEPGAAYINDQAYEPTLEGSVWVYNLPAGNDVIFETPWTDSISDGNKINITGAVAEVDGKVFGGYRLIDVEFNGQVTIYGLPWGTSELHFEAQ